MGIYFIGWLCMLAPALREGLLWGLAVFFLPVSLLFAIRHWEEVKIPFFIRRAGAALVIGTSLFESRLRR